MMITPGSFFDAMKQAGINLFAGVPDSLLSNLCAYIDDNSQPSEHIITANEGNAIALAAGFHLSSGKYAAVYMQNSGLGNTINPLSSLTDPEVYKIPMLLIVGWRGEPGIKDEPQHVKQGRITPRLLDLLEIPYWVLGADSDSLSALICALEKMQSTSSPVALLVRQDTFTKYKSQRKSAMDSSLKREEALRTLLQLTGSDLVISTTGKTSREVFELRVERNELQRDFLTVGSMGHTSSIALGIALGNPAKRVICIDGDGSMLMHLGALPIIGSLVPKNLVHVLLNNAAHDSVGGQPTVADRVDFEGISKASGYTAYARASDVQGIEQAWQQLDKQPGPVFLEIRITTGSRDDLGRPTSSPEENKVAFMLAAN